MPTKKITSIKANAISNYFGQGYTIVLTLLCTPFYLQYLGAEAYGLVGFFIIMQNWLNLLDMGLGTTLCRQVSVARGQNSGFRHFKNLVRSFELVFAVLVASILAVFFFKSNWIAFNWLQTDSLSPNLVSYCINIMGLIVGLRFFSTLYRGGIIGFEDQVWLNQILVFVASLKYIGAGIIMAFISNEIQLFFEFQFVIAALEMSILCWRFYYNLPSIASSVKLLQIDWSLFREILPFSLGVAYTSLIQLFAMQLDKLLLSGLLSLKTFGYFSLITIVSSGLITLSVPIFTACQPRLTVLAAQKSLVDMISLYTDMTQMVTWVVFSTAMLIVIYPQVILHLLTGDDRAYAWGGEALQWYVLGACVFVMGSCQYYLQNAYGNLSLYVRGLTLSLIIQVPLIYFVTSNYGAIGASKLWFVYSLIWFFGFTSIVHGNFIPKFHLGWLLKDILPVILWIGTLSFCIKNTFDININPSKIELLIKLILISVGFFALSSLSVKLIRRKIIEKLIGRKSLY